MSNDIYVAETANKGKSFFAKRDFSRGETVLVVAGPIVKVPSHWTIPIDFGLFIDPVPVDNLGRYLNHSCEPTCGIKNRSLVVAMRDVKKDEEINIDYAMIVATYTNLTDEQRKCMCGSSSCRGKLGAYSELSDLLKEHYKGFISDYLLEKRD